MRNLPSHITKEVSPNWFYIKTEGAMFFARKKEDCKALFRAWWRKKLAQMKAAEVGHV